MGGENGGERRVFAPNDQQRRHTGSGEVSNGTKTAATSAAPHTPTHKTGEETQTARHKLDEPASGRRLAKDPQPAYLCAVFVSSRALSRRGESNSW